MQSGIGFEPYNYFHTEPEVESDLVTRLLEAIEGVAQTPVDKAAPELAPVPEFVIDDTEELREIALELRREYYRKEIKESKAALMEQLQLLQILSERAEDHGTELLVLIRAWKDLLSCAGKLTAQVFAQCMAPAARLFKKLSDLAYRQLECLRIHAERTANACASEYRNWQYFDNGQETNASRFQFKVVPNETSLSHLLPAVLYFDSSRIA